MKTLIAIVALGLANGFFNPAHAESFNERGEDFIASVRPDSRIQRQPVEILLGGFNDRGHDHGVMTYVASSKSLNDFRIASRGFNNRSHATFY